jgi:hypothetical protein
MAGVLSIHRLLAVAKILVFVRLASLLHLRQLGFRLQYSIQKITFSYPTRACVLKNLGP